MKKVILLACLAFIISSCKKDKKVAAPAKVIGDTYQGGIIFYVDGTGQHGLIAAKADVNTGFGNKWGCVGAYITGAEKEEVGTGLKNTIAILADCGETGTAAKICVKLNLEGYQDWFLPSKNELNLMYTNLFLKDLGTFTEACYWSSTEKDDDNAWVQSFTKDSAIQKQLVQYKSDVSFNGIADAPFLRVRAVRAF